MLIDGRVQRLFGRRGDVGCVGQADKQHASPGYRATASALLAALLVDLLQDGDALRLRGHYRLDGLLQLVDERAVVDALGGADAEADSPQLGLIFLNDVAAYDAQIIAMQQIAAMGLQTAAGGGPPEIGRCASAGVGQRTNKSRGANGAANYFGAFGPGFFVDGGLNAGCELHAF